jgi:glucose/arabinose dehydrogenase
MEQPWFHWSQTMAPSGMAFLTSDHYGPAWRGSLLVGSLRDRHLARLEIRGGQVVSQERLLASLK